MFLFFDNMSSQLPPHVVVIGSGIAGVTFVQTFTALCPDVKVTMISASSIMKTVKNVVKRGHLMENFDVEESDAESFLDGLKNVHFILSCVTKLDTKNKGVILNNGDTISYDYLVICTGAKPHLINGAEDDRFKNYILGIRDNQTIDHLEQRIKSVKTVVVVGNGGISTELVYKISKCRIIWVIKNESISSTFFDPVAAQFLLPKLNETQDSEDIVSHVRKTKTFIVTDGKIESTTGSSLGPDWSFRRCFMGMNDRNKDVEVEFKTEIEEIISPQDLDDEHKDHPIYVKLMNGKIYGCDLIISATGVVPNTTGILDDNDFNIGSDGGLVINDLMETNIPDVYAAGDVCCCESWKHSDVWFQMRLWTQAYQMGCYTAYCLASKLIPQEIPDARFYFNCFQLFTHVTQFFGYKITLLGAFNGQNLPENSYKMLIRCKENDEFIKVIVKDGRVKGAILVGHTDLDETFENLILNQTDISNIEDDLLNTNVDIDDYFD